MKSSNEWSQLKTVIVGVADNAKIPQMDLSLRTVNYADKTDNDLKNINPGLYPKQVLDEANEDLEIFCNFLEKENVQVLRPDKTDCEYYNFCPRDSVTVIDEISVAAPMPLRARKNEYLSYAHFLKNLHVLDHTHSDDLYNLNCLKNPNVLALNESEPAFDAANILRANGDLLYLVSNSGNIQGANALQEVLGEQAKIHLLKDVYSYMHIDSTIAFLREGLMLVNPSRIKSKNDLPEAFRNWEIIFAPEPIDIGHYPGYCNASKWISVNLFSVNENLVVVEEHQDNLRKELEKYNIDCAMLPMRHARTLGGCFHCVTLDIERR